MTHNELISRARNWAEKSGELSRIGWIKLLGLRRFKMNSDEDKLFKDIKLQGIPLSECELAYKDKHDNNRLYVVKEDNSFWAHAVEFNSCPATEEKDNWKNDGLVVNTTFEITAYFDGVRHLEWNRNNGDMDGYLYYPSIYEIISMLQKVREIELEVCKNAE